MPANHVEIFTDGACSGNPGPGGWGAILRCGDAVRELSGGEAQTTNNRMELTAAIEALAALKRPCRVELYSDSKYLVDGVQKGWAVSWRKNGWRKGNKEPALNPDLWGRLLELLEVHQVTLHWVKGHAGHPENERCDALAVAQRDRFGVAGR
ncbi:ribonuclease HI [Bittarella sp. HCP28S3_D9]|uniref:ribonuclease HI n=1 Tax=Bittarella sp. HCP28S3_D9 TaxID=3440253 RepID=UPI003F8CD006